MFWRFATKMSGFESVMYATVYKLLYYLNIGICWLVDLFYNIFDKLAGLCKATYDGDADVLSGLLFSNGAISTVFWCMAILCVVLALGFVFVVMARRASEFETMVVRTNKEIMRGFGKTAVIVLSMTLVFVLIFNATGLLMQQAQYAWIDADDAQEETVGFSDEDFAAMARALNTIGNYSLNPAYNNRYNINSCYNEIRPDMQYLASRGVFRFNAQTLQDESVATWQTALQKIANAGSLSRELKIDVHYEEVTNAILETMELMRLNGTFKPLENYRVQHKNPNTELPVDRALFLTATLDGAKNDDLNASPSFNDSLRYAYYYGEKSIYDLDAVNEGFDIGKSAIEFLLFAIGGLMILKSLLVAIANFAARIFNMLMLYLLAIPTIARGEKEENKKWMFTFTVHALAVLAMLVMMRVMLIILPLILTAEICIFSYPPVDAVIKLVLLIANVQAMEKISCLITRKLQKYERLRSLYTFERPAGKKTILPTVKVAAGNVWTLTKDTIPLCAFVGQQEQPEQKVRAQAEEETPCDAVVLQKFNSWTNP